MAKKAAASVPDPKGSSNEVLLVRPAVKTMRLTIVGTSPLITHNWDPAVIESMDKAQQRKGSNGRKAADPEREFQTGRYLDAKNRDCILARGIKRAMVSAGTSIQGRELPKTLLRQAFFVQGDLIPLRAVKPVSRRDICRVKGGGACIRYRPMYETWEADIAIEFNENAISKEQLLGILELAGFGVGIHEWRPEKDGNFGRFQVKTR